MMQAAAARTPVNAIVVTKILHTETGTVHYIPL